MGSPSGFRWVERKNGDVHIEHRGKPATVLRRAKAADFLDDINGVDKDSQSAQDLMARLTGNYKRGNERQARRHPRNR